MHRLQAEDERLRAESRMNMQEFNAFKTLEHSTHGRAHRGFLNLIGNGLCRLH